MKTPIFKIYFTDKMCIEGHSLSGDWKKLPDKMISYFIFRIGKIQLTLENYNQYNHLIEKIQIQNKKTRINQILIMGRKDNETDIFIFDLKNNQFKKETVEKNLEYFGQQLAGWRPGFSIDVPKYSVKNI